MKKKIFLLCTFIACICHLSSAQEVFKNKEVTITKLYEGTWIIETYKMEAMYIVEGTEKAMLIDTGTKVDSLDQIVKKITSKPLLVAITHKHYDHAGNIHYFKDVYMHQADTAIKLSNIPFNGTFHWLTDGQKFDLGGRTIIASHMPGHTPGSMVFFDPKIHACYNGDAFNNQFWMQLRPLCSMHTFIKSCKKMEKLMKKQDITKLYAGHYPYTKKAFGIDLIQNLKTLAQNLVNGKEVNAIPFLQDGKKREGEGNLYIAELGNAAIVYDHDSMDIYKK